MIRTLRAAAAAALFVLAPFAAFAAEEPTIDELLDHADDINRGSSSRATMTMQVKTDRYERTMKMRALSRGTDESLVTILEPAKDAGISTLKVGENLWNYLPKVDRTMKIPAGMMGGSWMGSHFSNDDLVKQSRMSEDYTASLVSSPSAASPDTHWILELVAKPDAPVVWGKVKVDIRPDRVPAEIAYFDEKGTLVRTMAFSDVKQIGDRKVPMTMTLTPADKPGEYTKMVYEELEFDVALTEKSFTLQSLKQ